MYVRKAIETLLQHRDIKRSSHFELRTACEEALKVLEDSSAPKDVVANGTSSSPKSVSSVLPEPNPSCVQVEKFFLPFELACQSKTPKIVCTALDSIEKLVAYGHISYHHFGDDADFDYYDAEPAERHDVAPLFDDHLTSTVANCFHGPQTDEGIQVQVLKALLSIVTSGHIRVHENSLLLAVRTCYNILLVSRNLNYQATAKATLSQILNCVFGRMETACKAASRDQLQEAAGGGSEAHELVVNGSAAPLCETKRSSAFSVELDVARPIVMDVVELSMKRSDRGSQERTMTADRFANIMMKDCFLVFRSLCKLSMKPLPDGYPDPKSHELRSKVLSLQLLLGILQNGGEAFCNRDIFVSAIKSYLCVALSQNGVSNIGEVFELSLALFIELLTKYKRHLKPQVEIFFKEICLNILEAASSSFEQKWLVIEAIGKICSDAQMVVDIYVNYDCDLAAANVFERLVDVLSKVARGRQAFELGASPNQLKGIRLKGLECLACILKCMVEWSKDLYINPHVMSTLQQMGSAATTTTFKDDELNEFSNDLGNDPSAYEKVKQYKGVLEHGIRLFNQKPSKGIKYLCEQGLIEDTLEAKASFLHSESARLDKNAIGEYLGELDFRDVMHRYVDAMNFSGMEFSKALRHFLEGFRLPGEAQKIDRLMEKFASRYIECNPKQEIFASADTAYVLAFSIIMLTTDLHNSQVKKKMTKQEFIMNNRGINDSEDLPKEYLSKIYEEIASSEIKMKATSSHVGKSITVTDLKKRQEIWCMESANITKTAEALMESASSRSDVFVCAKHLEHIRPMFKLAWSPVLAAFSVNLQDNDNDANITLLCLEGIQCAIRIACIFAFSLERNAFVQALARFTLLTDNSNVTEIKSKNVESIKALISVAYSDGNYLENSWLDIMKCISQLEVAQNIGTNFGRDKAQSMSAFSRPGSVVVGLTGGSSADLFHEQVFRETMSQASSQSVVVAVDRIFTGSRNLKGDAIVHFVKALCQVSKDEISSPASPRMFCLNKLVEISYYNMERIRLEWSRIWQVLGTHFNVVGCNESQSVSIFAVDSLRQLSLKFLEKGELQNFHFQKDFLRPFEFIMKNNKSVQIRDMVVRCISQMVQSQASNIKSGWKNIFATFALAAADDDENIVALSFQATIQIVSDFLSGKLSSSIVESSAFQDCIKCLSEFGCSPLFPDVAMEAIRLIRKCARYVSEHKALFLDEGSDVKASTESDRVWIRGWFPVLFELSCIINSSKLDIRTRSLTILFDIVKNYGEQFESNWWLDLFRVLFRIFELVKNDQRGVDVHSTNHYKEWLDTTCNHTLYAMTDVFNEFFVKLAPILLSDLLAQYEWCVQQDNDQLAKSSVSCLENLVLTNRPKMDSHTEHTILTFLAHLCSATTIKWSGGSSHAKPAAHVFAPDLADSSSSIKSLKHRITVHLEIVQAVRRMVFGVSMKDSTSTTSSVSSSYSTSSCVNGGGAMPTEKSAVEVALPPGSDRRLIAFAQIHSKVDTFSDTMSLVDCLLHSHQVARSFLNQQSEGGGLDASLVPMLVKQETESLKCAVEILLELYQTTSSEHQSQAEPVCMKLEAKLFPVLRDLLSYFLSMTSKSQQECWTLLLCTVFRQLLNLTDAKFLVAIPVLYIHICDILSVSICHDLRSLLCRLLKRIGAAYRIVTHPPVPPDHDQHHHEALSINLYP